MLRIGLTGGIAAGKSTASARLAELGVTVIDYDVLAKEAVAPGSVGLSNVIEHFKNARLLASDGGLDRRALAELIFGNPKARNELEAIIHPIVSEIATEIEARAVRENPDAIVVHDIPLLVEAGLATHFDIIIAILAPAALRIQRLIETRNLTAAEASARVKAAAPDYRRAEIADIILDGTESPADLRKQVDHIYPVILRHLNDNPSSCGP